MIAGNLFVLVWFLLAPHAEPHLSSDVAVFMDRLMVWSLAIFVFPFFVLCFGLANVMVVLFICLIVFIVAQPSHPGYNWRTKLEEGVSLSNPHRTAIEIACHENNLKPRSVSEFHKHMKLEPPGSYKGTYIESISAEAYEDNRGRVTIVLSQLIKDGSSGKTPVIVVKPGDTLTYDGTCTPGGMIWKVSSSLPKRYHDSWARRKQSK